MGFNFVLRALETRNLNKIQTAWRCTEVEPLPCELESIIRELGERSVDVESSIVLEIFSSIIQKLVETNHLWKIRRLVIEVSLKSPSFMLILAKEAPNIFNQFHDVNSIIGAIDKGYMEGPDLFFEISGREIGPAFLDFANRRSHEKRSDLVLNRLLYVARRGLINDSFDSKGFPALSILILDLKRSNGQPDHFAEYVQILIDAGANVNYGSNCNYPPLMCALAEPSPKKISHFRPYDDRLIPEQHQQIVLQLLKAGAKAGDLDPKYQPIFR